MAMVLFFIAATVLYNSIDDVVYVTKEVSTITDADSSM
jgi:hypothetical protein